MRILALATLTLAVANMSSAAHIPHSNRRTAAASPDFDAKLDAFEAKYDALLRKRGVPGMFFGLATTDSVIRTGGVGALDVATPAAKVDGDSLFGIGSTAKAMTAALLSTLVAEGKIAALSDPIRKYYPHFALKDPYTSTHCSFEDAMSHRTGMADFEILEHVDRYGDPDGIARRLKHLDPVHEFRTTFSYNNVMWDTIGHAAAHIINANANTEDGSSSDSATYETAMQDRLFKPIGMDRTTTLTDVALKNGNLATPHQRLAPDAAKALNHDDVGVGGPSGSAYSSANDAIRFLQTLLRRGESSTGSRVLEENFVEDSIKPRMIIGSAVGGPKADSDTDFTITTYGLGWFVENYRGRRFVYHSGGVVGFSTFFAWLPEHGVAAVAATNCEVDFTSETAVRDLLDIFFGEDNRGKDWPKIFDREPRFPKLPPPVPNTTPSHADLSDYVGTYSHPAFGDARVSYDDARKSLVLDAVSKHVNCDLKHYHYDVFSCSYTYWPSIIYDLMVSFQTDPRTGKINQFSIPLDLSAPDVIFTRTD
ncbi:beta-lactamase/transpeptidase-like protein [Ramicandelaber brevisporus]|nr:beta-lactamase/transpeptidase-like protein [Ramicandelaber brevisporus]